MQKNFLPRTPIGLNRLCLLIQAQQRPTLVGASCDVFTIQVLVVQTFAVYHV